MNAPGDGDKLLEFIDSAKARGAGDQFLVSLLRQQGWSERRIYAAFAAFYQQVTGIAVPSRGSRAENARDAFLYLLAFVTLGIWAVALVWLVYVLADHALPSPLDASALYSGYSFHQDVAGQLASLIVAFPIFILVSRTIVRETRQRPESLDSGVRKWLTYIALVITSVCLLGDGVWFLQQFLLGDLTLRFVVKSLVLFAVAGAILWYYLGSVRQGGSLPSRDRTFGWVATVAAAAAVVVGFTGVGTPAYERSVQLDQTRVANLRAIANAVEDAYTKTKRLPATVLPIAGDAARDPATHEAYAYTPTRDSHYTLCATFESADNDALGDDFWKHPAGRRCFSLDATQSPG